MSAVDAGLIARLTPAHGAFAGLRAAGFDDARIDAVLRFYDEPHRTYHVRDHIREMLDTGLAVAGCLSVPQVLAILMHDVIYVPGAPRGTNEAMSAQLLRVYAAGLDRQLVEAAAAIVLDTAEHVPHQAESPLVLDLDLLRLALPRPVFERHSREVFVEQRVLQPVDDETAWRQFEVRRVPFFRQLLGRPAIYRTPAMHAIYEPVARANLRRALVQMEAEMARIQAQERPERPGPGG